jgi:hypothetical protein
VKEREGERERERERKRERERGPVINNVAPPKRVKKSGHSCPSAAASAYAGSE